MGRYMGEGREPGSSEALACPGRHGPCMITVRTDSQESETRIRRERGAEQRHQDAELQAPEAVSLHSLPFEMDLIVSPASETVAVSEEFMQVKCLEQRPAGGKSRVCLLFDGGGEHYP